MLTLDTCTSESTPGGLTEEQLRSVISAAKEGDVIHLFCMEHVPSDDGAPFFDGVELFSVVLVSAPTFTVLSRFFERPEWCDPFAGTTVRETDEHVTLIAESGRALTLMKIMSVNVHKAERTELASLYQFSTSQ